MSDVITYDRSKMEAELTRDEGYRLNAYLDSAKPPKRTIGVGRNLDANGTAPLTRTKVDVIRNGAGPVEIQQMLDFDIDMCEAALDKHIPWWRQLADARQRVLLNMCFNMGWGTLSQFVNTLNMVRDGRFIDASVAMGKSLWAHQVGDRAVRLQRMMRTGA